MARNHRSYDFVGEERAIVDAERFERALRAWSDYLVRHLAEERVRRRPGPPGQEP